MQRHLASLKSQRTAIQFQQQPELRIQHVPKDAVLIVFDGGTSCNEPKKGFGEGYGSYQISGDPIRRVKFGIGHSCNSAEIRTLHAALADLSGKTNAWMYHIHIMGDSKIALKWARPNLKGEPHHSCWKEFHTAIKMLREEIVKFGKITTQWHPRSESVKLFGH